MLAKWKQYQDMDYIDLDCRGLNDENMIAILEDAAEIMKSQNENVVVLANVTGVSISPEFMERFKSLTTEVYKDKVERTAIIGVDGMKSMIIKTYNFIMGRDVHTFSSEEEALAYLYETKG